MSSTEAITNPLSVSLSGVSFRYGAKTQEAHPDASAGSGLAEGTLAETNLEIPPGQCLVLTGPSGGGKTTLVRIMNGLIPHFYPGELFGEVKLAEAPGKSAATRDSVADFQPLTHPHLTQHYPRVILSPSTNPLWKTGSHVATVFQNPRTQFFTTDTTSEMAFGLENAGAAPELIADRVLKVTKTLGVEKLLGRSLFALSGGEKQLVATAGAAVSAPGLYLFDEPTSNLSPASITRFAEVLRELKSRGATIVIAEHRLYFLRDIADRVILVDGSIRADLPASDFFALPASRVTELGLRTLVEPKFEVVPTQEEIPPGHGLRLENLEVAYGKRRILNIPHFLFPRGKVTGITGRNGVGKSSLAAVLTGLKKARNGKVLLDEAVLKPKQRTRCSYLVMQDVNRQLFTESSQAEVQLGNNLSDTDALQILKKYDLSASAKDHPLSLSGGQKQRLTVASAVALNREFYVFDEPSSGLDLGHLHAITAALKELSAKGKIVILITHDPELMNAAANLFLNLDDFSIKEDKLKSQTALDS